MCGKGENVVLEGKTGLSVEKFRQFIDIMTPSMDDYLYVYDMPGDCYCISENALKRFPLKENCLFLSDIIL